MRGQEAYASYLRAARREFVQGKAATAEQIQGVYRRAAKGVRDDILALAQDAPALQRAHLTALQTALDKRAAEMSKEILSATHQGIWKSSSAGSKGVANVTTAVAAGAFQPEQIQRMFAGINERATLAMLARTRKDGLKLSDRVWRACETMRNNVQIIVEDAVARGQSARVTATQVEKYLQPGIWKAHKLETQQRLGVGADVSYQAMRLARTEMNNAFHEGTVASNQHCPAYLGVQWQLSAQHAVPDICTDMAMDLSHGGAGFYPRGKEPTKPHPNCMCVVLPVYEDPAAFTEKLRAWQQNPEAQPSIEKWYGENRRWLGRPQMPVVASVGEGVIL